MTIDARVAQITTPSERETRVERIFDAPRADVWRALTDPELLVLWWGPRGTTTRIDRWEAVVGTDWRVVITSGGVDQGFRGSFREVVAPERLVRSFEWEGMPGHVAIETMTLEDLGTRTRLVVTGLFHTIQERDGMLNSGMQRGTNESYERLDGVLGALAV